MSIYNASYTVMLFPSSIPRSLRVLNQEIPCLILGGSVPFFVCIFVLLLLLLFHFFCYAA